MKQVALALTLLAVASSGCGTQADPRLLVTDRLRTACGQFTPGDNWYWDDEAILVFIQSAETDRLNGFNVGEEQLEAQAACTDPESDFENACTRCFAAIVSQVYGY